MTAPTLCTMKTGRSPKHEDDMRITMSKRDVEMAEKVCKLMGWRNWRAGFESYIVGEYRGNTEIIHIKYETANNIIDEMFRVKSGRKSTT